VKATRSEIWRTEAFSLLELLAVIGIISVLLALSVPAFTSISRGNSLSFSAQSVGDGLILARQEASTRNRRAEIRFLKLPSRASSVDGFHALQVWLADDLGIMKAYGRPILLPLDVIILASNDRSPLLNSPTVSSGIMQVSGETAAYTALPILASGNLEEGKIPAQGSYFTIAPERVAAGSNLTNYAAVYINRATAQVRILRP